MIALEGDVVVAVPHRDNPDGTYRHHLQCSNEGITDQGARVHGLTG